MADMEVRKEDLGKMMLKKAPKLEDKFVIKAMSEYINDTKNRIYLLYSRELNYFTVFQNHSMLATDSAKHFVDFAKESSFFAHPDTKDDSEMQPYGMGEILEIEYNKNTNALELWIGEGNPKYFQFMAWDEGTDKL